MSNNQLCEQFELMLSAELDGELSLEESKQLHAHKAKCVSCQNMETNFSLINESLSALGTNESTASLFAEAPQTRQLENDRHWVLRLIPIGLAAGLLVAFGIMLWPQQNEVSANEIVDPFAEVLELNEQVARDQRMMIKTLELDLRSLRLEFAQAGEMGDRGEELEQRLSKLIEQVRLIELSTQPDHTGDE